MKSKAVFLDRDGTLNPNIPYLGDSTKFKLYDGVGESICDLVKNGYKVIVVTNQSGLSRGFFSLSDLESIHNKMIREINSKGGKIDAIYYCPHLPEDGCKCRKPKNGLIKLAINEHNIDIQGSYFIGDRYMDILAGNSCKLTTILVPERHCSDETMNELRKNLANPDYICDNFKEAINIIL